MDLLKLSDEELEQAIKVADRSKCTEYEQEVLNKYLCDIITTKQKICTFMKGNCFRCPLSQEDKCRELELPEFDFENNHWVYQYDED